MIGDGDVTFVMYLSCWKGLGSPTLSKSGNILTMLDGISFWPHYILPSLKVQLGGKTIVIEVKVFNVLLDYNILLGRNWI